jgi:hypothetical protein
MVRSIQQAHKVSNIDIWLKVPFFNRACLYSYLNGDEKVRLSEKTIDAVIAAIDEIAKERAPIEPEREEIYR